MSKLSITLVISSTAQLSVLQDAIDLWIEMENDRLSDPKERTAQATDMLEAARTLQADIK